QRPGSKREIGEHERSRRMNLSRHPLLVGLITATLFAATVIGVAAQTTGQRQPNTITVTGSATVSLPPDLAAVSGSVQTQADTAAAAADQNSRTLQAVIDAVQALGITPDNIITTGFNVSPQYSYTQPQPGQPSQ